MIEPQALGALSGTHELLLQVVELDAYRISRRPVRNSEYLAFVKDGGYTDKGWWDRDGRDWKQSAGKQAAWE